MPPPSHSHAYAKFSTFKFYQRLNNDLAGRLESWTREAAINVKLRRALYSWKQRRGMHVCIHCHMRIAASRNVVFLGLSTLAFTGDIQVRAGRGFADKTARGLARGRPSAKGKREIRWLALGDRCFPHTHTHTHFGSIHTVCQYVVCRLAEEQGGSEVETTGKPVVFDAKPSQTNGPGVSALISFSQSRSALVPSNRTPAKPIFPYACRHVHARTVLPGLCILSCSLFSCAPAHEAATVFTHTNSLPLVPAMLLFFSLFRLCESSRRMTSPPHPPPFLQDGD